MVSEATQPLVKQIDAVNQDIPVYQLADPSYVTRVNINVEALQELVVSIKERGILVPLLVRPEGDHFRVIDGHRRLIACKQLNLEKVPCRIITEAESDSLLDSIIANNVREDNTPWEILQASVQLAQKFELGTSAIAAKLGKSEGYIRDLLSLASLPAPVQEEIHKGTLSVPAAKQLLRIETPEEQVILGRDFAAGRSSGAQAESITNAYLMIRKRQKEMPPEKASEMALADPQFECEWCHEIKPIRGCNGRVACRDCYEELVYLWRKERRTVTNPPTYPKEPRDEAQTLTQSPTQIRKLLEDLAPAEDNA